MTLQQAHLVSPRARIRPQGITGFCNVRGQKLPFEAGAMVGLAAGALYNTTSNAAADNKFCRCVALRSAAAAAVRAVGVCGVGGNEKVCVCVWRGRWGGRNWDSKWSMARACVRACAV